MKTNIVVLNIEIEDSPYKIARKIKVPAYLTLAQLHSILQIIFEWENSHLYRFEISKEFYSTADYEDANVDALHTTKNVRISDILLKAKQFIYEYDFGDSWRHLIKVEKTEQVDNEDFIPVCISATGEPPFEDVGGVGGFENILNIAKKKKLTQEDKELIEWTGLSAKEIRELPTYPIDVEDINNDISDYWEDIKAGKDI